MIQKEIPKEIIEEVQDYIKKGSKIKGNPVQMILEHSTDEKITYFLLLLIMSDFITDN